MIRRFPRRLDSITGGLRNLVTAGSRWRLKNEASGGSFRHFVLSVALVRDPGSSVGRKQGAESLAQGVKRARPEFLGQVVKLGWGLGFGPIRLYVHTIPHTVRVAHCGLSAAVLSAATVCKHVCPPAFTEAASARCCEPWRFRQARPQKCPRHP